MSEHTYTIGVDPGLTGAIVVLEDKHVLAVWDMPTRDIKVKNTQRKQIDGSKLYAITLALPKAPVWIENVHSMPRDSHVSAFKFGHTVGTITACLELAGLQLTYVAPQAWKTRMGLGADKQAAMAHASFMFGGDKHWPLKKHHGRAEAAMIAAFGYYKTRGYQ